MKMIAAVGPTVFHRSPPGNHLGASPTTCRRSRRHGVERNRRDLTRSFKAWLASPLSVWSATSRPMCGDTYPDARWVPPKDAEHSGFWAVPLRIKPDPDELHSVIADLEHERSVHLSTHGKILEADNCEAHHEAVAGIEDIQNHLSAIPDIVRVAIAYPSFIADPKTWLQPTWWDAGVRRKHPHMNADGSACVFYAPAAIWDPTRDNLAQYVDQLAIWVLKSEIWVARGARPDGEGWPGPSQDHSFSAMLLASPDSRCQCGRGRPYGVCCRPEHMKMLLSNRPPSVVGRDQDDSTSPVAMAASSFDRTFCKIRNRPPLIPVFATS